MRAAEEANARLTGLKLRAELGIEYSLNIVKGLRLMKGAMGNGAVVGASRADQPAILCVDSVPRPNGGCFGVGIEEIDGNALDSSPIMVASNGVTAISRTVSKRHRFCS